MVCAECPDAWLEQLYRSAEFEESQVNDTSIVTDTVNAHVHLKHQCSVGFLLSRQRGVKGATTNTLTTAKEVEKGAFHFGARDQAPTAFYTEGLAFVQGLTSLKREDLVKTSTQTASWVGRMGAVVHSYVTLALASIEQHSEDEFHAYLKDRHDALAIRGQSLGLSPGAALFEKVETVLNACEPKLRMRSKMHIDFAGSIFPAKPAVAPFGEPGSALTAHGAGDAKAHSATCRFVNALAALIRNTNIPLELSKIYVRVARENITSDKVLFEALAANAQLRVDCAPGFAALLESV